MTEAAAAAGAVALAVARAATTPKAWPRSAPKITEAGDASCTAPSPTIQTAIVHFFFARWMLCWQLAFFFVSFAEQASLLRVMFHLFYIDMCSIANHSAVIPPHPTKGAKNYCCIRAGGILAATGVCCAGCTPLCAGRCARRLLVLLVVLFLLLP